MQQADPTSEYSPTARGELRVLDGRLIDAQRAADHLGLAQRRLRELDALEARSVGATTEARDLRRAMPALAMAAAEAASVNENDSNEGRPR